MSKPAASRPITVALVDDYDVVLIGLAHMFDRYRERVVVAEIDTNEPLADSVDVALYDTFAQPEADHDDIGVLIASPRARHTAVYTWNFHPELIESAIAQGASGYLSKTLPAHALVAAIESIHGGEVVISPDPGKARIDVGLEWPGKSGGSEQPRVGDPRADHPGQTEQRDRPSDLPQPEHDQDLHPLGLPQDRRRAAAPRPCCGESSTASAPTIGASTTGAVDHDRSARHTTRTSRGRALTPSTDKRQAEIWSPSCD